MYRRYNNYYYFYNKLLINQISIRRSKTLVERVESKIGQKLVYDKNKFFLLENLHSPRKKYEYKFVNESIEVRNIFYIGNIDLLIQVVYTLSRTRLSNETLNESQDAMGENESARTIT